MVGAVGADFQPGVELLHKNHIAAAGAFKQQVLRDFGTMGSLNLPVGIIIIAAVSLSAPVPVKIHPGTDDFPDIFKHTLTRAGLPDTFPFRDVWGRGRMGYLVSRPILRPRKPIS